MINFKKDLLRVSHNIIFAVMIKAEYKDKATVVNILTKSFDTNKSVNFVIKQDKNRVNRIRELMNYSFEMCFAFGEVFLSPDKRACALILFPDKKKTNIQSVLWDVSLIWNSVGIMNIGKTLQRESKIKNIHPKELMYYLWFIGVDPQHQNKGIGTKLLIEISKDSVEKERSIFLETSTIQNLPWYQNNGFEIYNSLELGYKLYFLRTPPQNSVQDTQTQNINFAHY